MLNVNYNELLSELLPIGWEAAEMLMKFHGKNIAVQHKKDDSPVSEADHAAHLILRDGLERITPQITIISEEDDCHASPAESFWLVDPLDGTKSFLRNENEFVVSVGLIENARPVFGLIIVPTQQCAYWGGVGLAALKQAKGHAVQPIACREIGASPRALVSHFHRAGKTETYLQTHGITDYQRMSSALKFCVLAEGGADVIPRFGPTMEWDTAAGQAIVEAAGGSMQTLNGEPFTYGKAEYRNGGFIAQGRR